VLTVFAASNGGSLFLVGWLTLSEGGLHGHCGFLGRRASWACEARSESVSGFVPLYATVTGDPVEADVHVFAPELVDCSVDLLNCCSACAAGIGYGSECTLAIACEVEVTALLRACEETGDLRRSC